ncbi:MAG: magnesium-translocating P-type ATPase, partial [Oscillospiraceae bacterium]|nr:magnesium-translocating P-type ATPase [Oscillospiraceae bacterium]
MTIFKKKTANKPNKAAVEMAARQKRVRRRLTSAAIKKPETLLIQYDTDWNGFDEDTVEDMRDQYGANTITRHNTESIPRKLWDSFVNPFTVVLFVLAVISLITKEYEAAVIISSMVFLSGVIRFIQELRSHNAAARLGEMVETTAAVMRSEEEDSPSEKREIPLDEIVVGDVIHLAAGDIIPADIRILRAKDLFVNQASLTGESEPVEKYAEPMNSRQKNPLELNNLAFMGSTVISGSAAALVIAVGDDTYLGEISSKLQEKTPPTSFEKGVKSVSWVLIWFMVAMVPIVFIISGLRIGWLEGLLFGLSIAVGLTPEMLPMIVSANLAKGAVSMSKKKVIVKELNSIQNFGAMDVLCTDKTGTLTQDKIILEYHLNIHGEEDDRVLRHAFLNSYYQTGLKNLMDISIIERAREAQVVREEDYRKIDEIPFDFARRRMSVVVESRSGKTQLITKGAIEEMLAISSFVEYNGVVEPITDEIKAEVLAQCSEYNADGLRVLGIAQKTNPPAEGAFSVADESDMVLIGYLAFLDPPKESAAEAIAALHEYGVTVKVLTGDNDAVTKSV